MTLFKKFHYHLMYLDCELLIGFMYNCKNVLMCLIIKSKQTQINTTTNLYLSKTFLALDLLTLAHQTR